MSESHFLDYKSNVNEPPQLPVQSESVYKIIFCLFEKNIPINPTNRSIEKIWYSPRVE